MSVDPVTREHLDSLTCANANHGIVMSSRCHPGNPQRVIYWGDGTIEVRCHICNLFVISVAVAADDQVLLDPKTHCGDPTCKEPVENHRADLKPPCHPRSGARGEYSDGFLTFRCSTCKSTITTVGVKPRAGIA